MILSGGAERVLFEKILRDDHALVALFCKCMDGTHESYKVGALVVQVAIVFLQPFGTELAGYKCHVERALLSRGALFKLLIDLF